MKTDVVFRRAYNEFLDLLESHETGAALPSESRLSETLGVSRTTVRKVLSALQDCGVLDPGPPWRKRATRVAPARCAWTETVAHPERAEREFMHWVVQGGAKPGSNFSELDLAHRMGVPTTIMRELLAHFRRFGLVQALSNGRWRFIGFNRAFACELFDVREMFEQRAALTFSTLPDTSPLWWRLTAIRKEHLSLLSDFDRRSAEFPDLDSRFHRLICAAEPNRFLDNMFDVITLVFHYHYLWNRADETTRNRAAVIEHLDYIEALQSRDKEKVSKACAAHLASARQTLMRSIPDRDGVSPARDATSGGPEERPPG